MSRAFIKWVEFTMYQTEQTQNVRHFIHSFDDIVEDKAVQARRQTGRRNRATRCKGFLEEHTIALHLHFPRSADDVQVTRPRKTVVLVHKINING